MKKFATAGALALALISLCLLAWSPAPLAATATPITQTRFVSGPELVTQLVVGAQPGNWVPIYKVTVPSLAAGQRLIIHGEFEVTTNYTTASGVNPMIESRLEVNGQMIDKANGTNVTPDQHHWVEKRSGSFQAQTAMTNVTVEIDAWSTHDLLKPGQVALIVEQNYGQLEAIAF